MLAKVFLLILSIGVCACTLLMLRQQRLQVVSDMAQVHRRIADNDKALLELRTQIARASSPARIESLASRLGPMQPIGIDPVSLPAHEPSPIRLAAETSLTKPVETKKPRTPGTGPDVARGPARR